MAGNYFVIAGGERSPERPERPEVRKEKSVVTNLLKICQLFVLKAAVMSQVDALGCCINEVSNDWTRCCNKLIHLLSHKN
jgi:hypothetical protein